MVTRSDRKTLGLVLALTTTYLVVEVVGGLITNSLALLSDAGHMVSDVGGLVISMVAITLACRPPTPERPFGMRRLEIVAAMINGFLLVGIDVYIIYESYLRLLSPQEVQSLPMLSIAAGGLVINLMSAVILSRSSKRSLNIRSAFLHVLTDALSSVGVIVAGIVIFFTDFYILDALAGLFIGVMMIPSIRSLLKESMNILLESCPIDVGIPQVKSELRKVQGVKDAHDLHIWSISSGIHSLSVHLIIEDLCNATAVLKSAKNMLHEKFDIHHATIQVEEICHDEIHH